MFDWLEPLGRALPDGLLYYSLVVLITFAESLPVVGLVVPGSTLAVFVGFLAFQGKGSIVSIVISSMIGAFIGDYLSYWLGLSYGPTLLKTKGLQKLHNVATQAQALFVNHGGKSLFFARFLGPIRGITPFMAGLSRMPRLPFLIYTLISTILWGLSYPGLGYLGGSSWKQAESLTAKIGLVVFGLLLLVAVQQLTKKFFEKQKRPAKN